MSHSRRLTLKMILLAAAGCGRIAPPYIFHPGTEAYQQARAQRFDPYADPQIGPDNINIDGIRPRGFVQPASEVKRTQINADAARNNIDSAMPAAGE